MLLIPRSPTHCLSWLARWSWGLMLFPSQSGSSLFSWQQAFHTVDTTCPSYRRRSSTTSTTSSRSGHHWLPLPLPPAPRHCCGQSSSPRGQAGLHKPGTSGEAVQLVQQQAERRQVLKPLKRERDFRPQPTAHATASHLAAIYPPPSADSETFSKAQTPQLGPGVSHFPRLHGRKEST